MKDDVHPCYPDQTTNTHNNNSEVAEAWETILPDNPQYRPDVDGLRAIAVLAVIGFHAAPGRLPAGFVGVDIFFVISGYLISSIILGRLKAGTFSFAEFYSRRVKRIFPALLLVLIASLAIGYFILIDDQFKALGKNVAGGAGFVSNFMLWSESGYFDNAANYKPLLHLWSLGIEEQFYIIWPFMLWLTFKLRFNYLSIILAVTSISFALNIYQVGNNPVATFYSPLTRFWELLVGATLAYVGIFTQRVSSMTSIGYLNAVSLCGMSLLAVSLVAINKEQPFPGWWALLPTVGAAFVIRAGSNAWFNRTILSNRALVWFGLISFPLYLWHWPLLSFLRILEGTEVAQWKRGLAIALAIALAWITYSLVEKPIRQGSKRKSTPLLLAALMSILGLVGCYGYFANGFEGRSGTPKAVNTGEIGHFQFFGHINRHSYPCTPLNIRKAADDWNGFIRCFQSKDGDVRNVAIIGDSHAEHLFPGLAANLSDRNVVFYGKSGLPFLNNKDFDQIFEIVMGDANIKVVVMAANWGEKLKNYPVGRWKQELGDTVTNLSHAGKLVYIVDDVPAFSFMPDRCKYDGRLSIENKCVESDRQANLTYLPAFKALVEKTESAEVNLIRIYDLFCNAGSCSMARDGVLLYRDEHHLNFFGSQLAGASIAHEVLSR